MCRIRHWDCCPVNGFSWPSRLDGVLPSLREPFDSFSEEKDRSFEQDLCSHMDDEMEDVTLDKPDRRYS